MNYSSGPPKYGRRKFFGRFLGGAGAILLGGSKSLYADDRIENEKIIEDFNKIYGKVKGRSGKFVEPIDINGDGTPDKVEFELKDNGSVSIDYDPTSGIRLDVGFEIGGTWLGKVYAVFKGGKIMYYKDGKPLCKRQFVSEENIGKHFDFMLKHYEK